MSDIDTAMVDSLKVLDPNRPIREADIRRERRLRHAESQALQLAMPACFTVDEIGRVDPSVNDSSTPSARLQIALQKRPLIDCQSGHDFAGGKVNSKAVTTAGAMCSRVILRVSERNSRLVEFEVIERLQENFAEDPRRVVECQ